MAQLWLPPAAMPVTPLERPCTCTGIVLLVVVPSPSCPRSFVPQHCAPPLTTAQLCVSPTPIAVTFSPSPCTSTGTRLSSVLPFPSWPNELPYQHLAPPPTTAQT